MRDTPDPFLEPARKHQQHGSKNGKKRALISVSPGIQAEFEEVHASSGMDKAKFGDAVVRAGLEKAREAQAKINAELGNGRRVHVLVNNSDGLGQSYGSHCDFNICGIKGGKGGKRYSRYVEFPKKVPGAAIPAIHSEIIVQPVNKRNLKSIKFGECNAIANS